MDGPGILYSIGRACTDCPTREKGQTTCCCAVSKVKAGGQRILETGRRRRVCLCPAPRGTSEGREGRGVSLCPSFDLAQLKSNHDFMSPLLQHGTTVGYLSRKFN